MVRWPIWAALVQTITVKRNAGLQLDRTRGIHAGGVRKQVTTMKAGSGDGKRRSGRMRLLLFLPAWEYSLVKGRRVYDCFGDWRTRRAVPDAGRLSRVWGNTAAVCRTWQMTLVPAFPAGNCRFTLRGFFGKVFLRGYKASHRFHKAESG